MNQPSSAEINPEDIKSKASELLDMIDNNPALEDNVDSETIDTGMDAIGQSFAARLHAREILRIIARGDKVVPVSADAFLTILKEDLNKPSIDDGVEHPAEREFIKHELGETFPSDELGIQNLINLATENFGNQKTVNDIELEMIEDMRNLGIEIDPDAPDFDEDGISKVNKAIAQFLKEIGRILDGEYVPPILEANIDQWKAFYTEAVVPQIKTLVEPPVQS